MEQEDRFGLKSIPAILMGVDHINSLYSDVFQLNVLRTTFGPTCSPIGKAVAFADVHYISFCLEKKVQFSLNNIRSNKPQLFHILLSLP
jgi:hypothetical protein